MSTNKTQNYQLHRWEPEDDFLRQEFNENFAIIDGQLLRVIIGQYTGEQASTTTTQQYITLGWKPKVVFVISEGSFGEAAMSAPGLTAKNALIPDENGFFVANQTNANGHKLNYAKQIYYYLALV